MSTIKIYNSIGKILCGLAGIIVGYVCSGPIAALLGLVAGIGLGYVCENRFS
jgi:hypothetical protein